MSKLINKNLIFGSQITLVIVAILALGAVFAPLKASAQYDDGYDHFMAPSQNPIPMLYSISPSSVNVGDNVNTITISGHGFTQNSVARWNGSSRPTTFIDSDHLLIHLSASDLSGSNGRYINVYNPNRGAYSTAALLSIKGYVPANNNTNTNYNNGNGNSNSNYSNSGNNSNGSNYNNGNSNYSNSQTQGSNGYNNSNGNNSNGSTSGNDNVSSLASNAIFGVNGFLPSGLMQWVLFAIIILLIIIIVRKLFGGEARYHSTPLKHS